MTRRFLVLLLVASLCFAVLTICVSAADAEPSVSVIWSLPGGSTFLSGSATLSSSYSQSGKLEQTMTSSLSISVPSAGTLFFTVSPCKNSFTLSGLTQTISDSSASFSFVAPSAGTFTASPGSSYNAYEAAFSISISSWTPSGGSGGGGGGDTPGGDNNDSSGNSILGPSQGGMDIWNSDGSINGDQRNDITGNSSQWNIHDTYIGQLDYFIQGDEATYETSVWISKMLANLSYTTWSWKYDDATGNFLYVRPNPGSWLDNMWQMNIYLYYNLANQKGWFGHINSEFATLNSRVLQILSVLANDEDVKIKDATTDHRNWITDFFEGVNTGKPTTSDNDAVNDSMNTVKDQFQSSYTVGDIGSIFSGNSYDNNIWYTFWSQPVFNDVNGIDRGGFGGGKAPARAPAASKPSWSSQYSYDDDSIPDMSGFGGGLSD